MKELLYKKSEAVAALNRVDGFHPMELARKIGEEGQEEQLYLDVKYRKLWFRLVNPAGKIISRIITFRWRFLIICNSDIRNIFWLQIDWISYSITYCIPICINPWNSIGVIRHIFTVWHRGVFYPCIGWLSVFTVSPLDKSP